jgi:protein phosphatase
MIQYAYQTDRGSIRLHNEDALIIRTFDRNPEGFDIESYGSLFTIADGMGGHNAGEIASNMACQAMLKYYHRPGVNENTMWDYLKGIFYQTNENVLMQSLKIVDFNGMGTTLTTLVIRKQKAWIAHVGDTRVYIIRGHDMDQVTQDHTEIQSMLDQGLFSQEEVKQCRARNILSQAIGVDNRLRVFTWAEVIQPEDMFLLCSDGLYDMLSNDQIFSIIQSHPNQLQRACRELIEKAKRAGGADNISLILVKVLKS